MTLNAISIQNLRSLVDCHSYALRPLTLIVGANSSGKSTFLRTFPLLRQSVETVTRGPILWYGKLVDFGVFSNVVSRGVTTQEIAFGFDVTLQKNAPDEDLPYYVQPLSILDDLNVNVVLTVAEAEGTSNTYAKRIAVTVGDHTVTVNAEANGTVTSVELNETPIRSSQIELRLRSGTSLFALAPTPMEGEPNAIPVRSHWTLRHGRSGAFPDLLLKHTNCLFHGNTDQRKKYEFVARLGIGTETSVLTQVKALVPSTPNSQARAAEISGDPQWVKRLQGLLLADRLPYLLAEVDSFLATTFRSVRYIGPLRATAERFYRQQDLAVDEVDPQGANLAMFLMGLSDEGREAFSLWCHETVGFKVRAETVGSHVSLFLCDSLDGQLYNVADMGFGYSQLLPVLATIWRATNGRSTPYSTPVRVGRRFLGEVHDENAVRKIIAVEQPELHLHARLQGKLATLLGAIAHEGSDSPSGVCLVCETHSETIINQIGKLVSEGKIPSEKVQVLLFERKDGEDNTGVRIARYDANGVLENWPYGFFLPSED